MRVLECITEKHSRKAVSYNVRPNDAYERTKRFIDVVLSAVFLVLLSPILAVIAIAVKMSSKGSVIFRQKRVGYKGRLFTIYKFRTMKEMTGGDEYPKINATGHIEWNLVFRGTDPRITRLGRFLRKTSIDELPQLVNVLKGDMSLVGPRPLLAVMIEPYKEFNAARSVVRPGITGLWQISARSYKNDIQQMIMPDIEYIRNYKLRLDINILIRTIPKVISCKGAF
jgi:lipopolysaccharide/colanic/teichoic acid biosynthesis glycosyltransferase